MPKIKKTKTSISGADLMNLVMDHITDNDGVGVDCDSEGMLKIVDKQGRKEVKIEFTLELE